MCLYLPGGSKSGSSIIHKKRQEVGGTGEREEEGARERKRERERRKEERGQRGEREREREREVNRKEGPRPREGVGYCRPHTRPRKGWFWKKFLILFICCLFSRYLSDG